MRLSLRKLLILFLTVSGYIAVFAQHPVEPVKVMESFEEGIPEGLKATGDVSIDTLRYKYGKNALRWDWKANDCIVFDTHIGYHRQGYVQDLEHLSDGHGGSETNPVLEPPRGFFLYVYNTTPGKQRMRFQFGRGDTVDCEFDFNLDFKGWRTLAVGYDRGDMRGVPREDMSRLTINAPPTGSGTFYFDMMGLSVTMNPRTVNANPQLPEIDRHPRLVAQYPHLIYEFSKYRPVFPLQPLDDNTCEDFRQIEKNIADVFFPSFEKKKFKDQCFQDIKKAYDQFEIYREGNHIYGRPLIYNRILLDYFSRLEKDNIFDGIQRWRPELGYTLLDIAKLRNSTESENIRKQLDEMFINLFDYAVDQGFDSGAGLGWIHHYSYIIREHAPAFYLMKDVLKEHGKLEKAIEICKWFYAFNQVYNEEKVYEIQGRKSANADEIQGLVPQKLLTVMMMPDSPEKARDIRHFSSYFSNVTTAWANALDETFKPDGTHFHHAGHAHGYGGRAILGAAKTAYMLSGTQFAQTQVSYNRLKKVVNTFAYTLFTQNQMAPKAFAGIRFSNYELPDVLYPIPALMACSAAEPDMEMKALYSSWLNAWQKEPTSLMIFWDNKLTQKGLGYSEYVFTKIRQLPYSCVTVKRNHNKWMIALRMHSKYIYPFESWGKSFFAYPLFIANGYLDVSYPLSLDSPTPDEGVWYQGYDWHRWPGVTSVYLPYKDMITDPGQVRDEGGEYLFSDQAFSGGVETSYGAGVSVFQFKGHDKFGLEGFTGKKTYFFFDNKVLCMGTGINSDINDYEVETVLFQTSLKDSTDPLISSSFGEITSFPFVGKQRSRSWIIDNRGTGYFLLGENDAILQKIRQTNPQYQDKGSVSGDFASAYISHGKAPSDASYLYLLVADATENEMNQLSDSLPVDVVRSDEDAHVVMIPTESITAYAVYKKEGSSFKNGPVASVNKQSVFIARQEKNDLRLSVADPDLNIYEGQDDLLPDGTRTELSVYEKEWFFWPSKTTSVQITLKGDWKIKQQVKEIETSGYNTVRIISSGENYTCLEFECRDGLSSEIILCR